MRVRGLKAGLLLAGVSSERSGVFPRKTHTLLRRAWVDRTDARLNSRSAHKVVTDTQDQQAGYRCVWGGVWPGVWPSVWVAS